MTKDIHSSYPGRKEFERGANLLKESIENNRISISPHAQHLAYSLCRVKMLPNGRLNLYTVDELVRTNFHMLVANPWKRYETKK